MLISNNIADPPHSIWFTFCQHKYYSYFKVSEMLAVYLTLNRFHLVDKQPRAKNMFQLENFS
jgi:hypothetical protein